MKSKKISQIISFVFIGIFVALLSTGCATWKAYPGASVEGQDAVLKVSPTDTIYVAYVDGMRYPQNPQAEFQGTIRLLPGRHRIMFTLHGGIIAPGAIGIFQSGEPIVQNIFAEPGKTYIPHAHIANGHWSITITENP
jgi:hypothetical protein